MESKIAKHCCRCGVSVNFSESKLLDTGMLVGAAAQPSSKCPYLRTDLCWHAMEVHSDKSYRLDVCRLIRFNRISIHSELDFKLCNDVLVACATEIWPETVWKGE